MNPERFGQVVKELLWHCNNTLLAKNSEYSRDGERLWNFKVAGRVLDVSPEEALIGMRVKHEVSILDIVDDVVLRGKQVPSPEHLKEKFGDSINYLLLLYALLIDRTLK
jgi:hypothetical protein